MSAPEKPRGWTSTLPDNERRVVFVLGVSDDGRIVCGVEGGTFLSDDECCALLARILAPVPRGNRHAMAATVLGFLETIDLAPGDHVLPPGGRA